jgi:plasmid stabilization system protein ParE
MANEIKWSKNANKNLYKITSYLEEYLSEKSLVEFIDNVFECIDQISEFPEIGVTENKKTKLRSYLINKHLRLFYRTSKSNIILVAFIDTRTNPKKYPK